MTRRHAAILLVAIACAPTLIAAQSSPPISSADSAQVRAALAFLVTGNSEGADHGGFDEKMIGHWNVDSVMKRLSSKGIRFSDVNEADSLWFATRAQLRAEITARKGRSYTAVAYLGLICGLPYPEYSALRFTRDGTRLKVGIGKLHEVTFEREGAEWRIAGIKLVQRQGG